MQETVYRVSVREKLWACLCSVFFGWWAWQEKQEREEEEERRRQELREECERLKREEELKKLKQQKKKQRDIEEKRRLEEEMKNREDDNLSQFLRMCLENETPADLSLTGFTQVQIRVIVRDALSTNTSILSLGKNPRNEKENFPRRRTLK